MENMHTDTKAERVHTAAYINHSVRVGARFS